MFYASEILSQKNKTELSLVYFVSTAKNIKKTCRKEVIEMDFNTVFDKIANPKVPFALRLYSYLLNGIVKMWLIKVEFYRIQAKNMFLIKKKPVVITRRVVGNNVNLRVLGTYVDEIESEFNDNISLIPYESYNHHNSLQNRSLQGEVGSIEELNDPLFFNDDGGIPSFSDCENVKRIKKNLVDAKTQLEIGDIFLSEIHSKRIKCSENEDSVCCEASKKFANFISQIIKNPVCEKDSNIQNDIYFSNDFSIEDPRISSSASMEKHSFKTSSSEMEETALHRPIETRVLSFYNILIAATRGEIDVSQNKPFDLIEITNSFGEVIYF